MVPDIDPVLVPLHKGLLVDHYSPQLDNWTTLSHQKATREDREIGRRACCPLFSLRCPPPKDKCPGLDWYAYVDEDSNVTGTVSWAKMKHSAKFEGKIGADGTFLLQAHEVGGPGKGTVSGKLLASYLQIRIDNSGTGCDGEWWNIQRYQAPVGGVGGG